MTSTAHRSYVSYSDENQQRPVLGFEEEEGRYVPLVPNGEGELARAGEFGDEYEIKVVEPDYDTRKILHG